MYLKTECETQTVQKSGNHAEANNSNPNYLGGWGQPGQFRETLPQNRKGSGIQLSMKVLGSKFSTAKGKVKRKLWLFLSLLSATKGLDV